MVKVRFLDRDRVRRSGLGSRFELRGRSRVRVSGLVISSHNQVQGQVSRPGLGFGPMSRSVSRFEIGVMIESLDDRVSRLVSGLRSGFRIEIGVRI